VCAKEWRAEVRIGCVKEQGSLWGRAVGWRCGTLEIVGLFGGDLFSWLSGRIWFDLWSVGVF